MLESHLYSRGHWLDNTLARVFPIFLAKMKTFPVHLRNGQASWSEDGWRGRVLREKIIGGSSESLFQARHQSQNVRVKYLALQMEFLEPGRRCLCHYYIVKAINSALLPTLRYIAAHNGSPKLHYHASDQNCPAPGNHLLNFHNLSGHRGGTTAASESNASKGAKLCEKRYKTTFGNAEHKHQFVTGSWYFENLPMVLFLSDRDSA